MSWMQSLRTSHRQPAPIPAHSADAAKSSRRAPRPAHVHRKNPSLAAAEDAVATRVKPKPAKKTFTAKDAEALVADFVSDLSRSDMRQRTDAFDAILQALEASPYVKAPNKAMHFRRSLQRRLLALRPKRQLAYAFSEALRASAEATLRFYGLSPRREGLPTVGDGLTWSPAVVVEKVVQTLGKASLRIWALEHPELAGQPAEKQPFFAVHAKSNRLGSTPLIHVYVAWHQGHEETSAIGYCVPLLVAYRHNDGTFGYPNAQINALPTTFAKRGCVKYRITKQESLERMPAPVARGAAGASSTNTSPTPTDITALSRT